MFIFIPAVPNSELELEDGLGNLQLENGDALVLESSDPQAEHTVQVLDENPVLAIPFYWLQPFIYFQPDPGTFFGKDISWWQNQPTTLMPEYTSEYLYGDIHNYPDFFMQLSTPIFPPDGVSGASPTSTTPGIKGTGRTSTTTRGV
jgi:hypothetical protein